ncbi:MAG: type IV secretion system protein [Rickettsiales bacterium]
MSAQPYRLGRMLAGYGMLALAFMLMIDPAFAQAVGGASESFRCSGGRASGQLYDSGTKCPTVLAFNNIFSFLICNFEHLSSNLLGNMYCGVVAALTPAFLAVVTLAVTFQGVSFTLGLNPRATARDLQIFLLKISIITAFATNADYLIGLGYNFFVNGIRDGALVVLSAIPGGPNGNIKDGTQLYKLLDGFLGKVITFATDYLGAQATGDKKDFCKNAIFAVMAIMAVAFPPIFYLGLLILFRIAITFLRAVFGYIYAIVGIAFLMVLSPFFLSFALFRQTQQLFEKWVGYMVSFALQIVLLFAFLTFILLIDVKHISESLPNIIVYNENPQETTSFRFPWQYCTLCDFKIVDKNDKEITADKSGRYKSLIGEGKMVCKDNPPKPIGALQALAPPAKKTTGLTAQQSAEQNRRTSALLTFAGFGLLSLLVLAYVIEEILALLPSMAQSLASSYGGASYAPQLGGGFSPYGRSTASLPFEGLGREMFGEDSVDPSRASIGSFGRGLAHSGDSVTGTVKGVRDAVSGLITGRDGKGLGTGERDSSGQRSEGGIGNAFADWLSDPNRIDQ